MSTSATSSLCLAAQAGKPLLWIVCSGIDQGETEHFKQDYLDTLLPPEFYQLHTSLPLRNTKRVLEAANLEANTDVKDLFGAIKTNPVYDLPANLIPGVQCSKVFFTDKNDHQGMASVVDAACKEVLGRTGGAGFPVLCDGWKSLQISIVKRGLERAGVTALVYQRYAKSSCSEAEVEEWLRRKRSREEERCLITDEYMSRGWEASHLLVVAFYSTGGWENLVMRTVGYCALVKMR